MWLHSSAGVCDGVGAHLVGAGGAVVVGVADAALDVDAGADVVELCGGCDGCLWRRSGLLLLAACGIVVLERSRQPLGLLSLLLWQILMHLLRLLHSPFLRTIVMDPLVLHKVRCKEKGCSGN